MSKITDSVYATLLPTVEGVGIELVEVTYKKVVDTMNLTVIIDKDGGVTLNDCEMVHRAIDPILDELDPTNGAMYVLNVSSPGIDRPLTLKRDYEKNLGKEVSVSLFNKIDVGKKFVAVLKAYDLEEGEVTVTVKNQDYVLDIKNIAIIKPEIKF